MKYVVVLGDGMADYPVPELGGKTPLEVANKPNIDFIAKNGVLGLVRTIPDDVSPGSDTANLSVLGFDPKLNYTGRSPIEAVSMGVSLDDADVAYRCNLVTLSDDANYDDKIMLDYSSDEITSEEAAELIEDVNRRLGDGKDILTRAGFEQTDGISICFHAGISYRHCVIFHGGGTKAACTPPHDILTRRVGEYLPTGAGSQGDGDSQRDAAALRLLMRESYEYLCGHKVNRERVRRGLKPANSLWLWGQGKRLKLPSFKEKYGISGAVISAVDLIKGIGICAGLNVINVEGATGVINTNYEGKANAALKALDDGCDFVYIHVEAPDECGHRHEIENKVKSIEYLDARLIKVLLDGLESRGTDYKLMVLPDHPTPLSLRTHTRDAVPFAIYTRTTEPAVSGDALDSVTNIAACRNTSRLCYDESSAKGTGVFVNLGHTLMDIFLDNNA